MCVVMRGKMENKLAVIRAYIVSLFKRADQNWKQNQNGARVRTTASMMELRHKALGGT